MQPENDKVAIINAKLKEKILARTPVAGSHPTQISGLNFIRREQTNELRVFYKPFIGLTVQGFKRTSIGGEEYAYGKYHCFVAGMDMPSESYIEFATKEEPFLAISLDLDRSLVAALAVELGESGIKASGNSKGVAVMAADEKIMEAFLRITELLENPAEISVLAPLLIKEIHFRLLNGPQGAWLRAICSLGTTSNQVARAISWIRENFKSALNMEELAKKIGMSSSSFYRNFKQMTSVTPLQFQKTLRLYEAQRLMLANEVDVANAAYTVGYESSTQFIREYKRMFGKPPHRDIQGRRSKLQ